MCEALRSALTLHHLPLPSHPIHPPPPGNLVKILVHTDVTRYLDFKLIDGSYVFRQGAGIHKVPADGPEALKSSLLGLFQKYKL